jgi:hypothetical protein
MSLSPSLITKDYLKSLLATKKIIKSPSHSSKSDKFSNSCHFQKKRKKTRSSDSQRNFPNLATILGFLENII